MVLLRLRRPVGRWRYARAGGSRPGRRRDVRLTLVRRDSGLVRAGRSVGPACFAGWWSGRDGRTGRAGPRSTGRRRRRLRAARPCRRLRAGGPPGIPRLGPRAARRPRVVSAGLRAARPPGVVRLGRRRIGGAIRGGPGQRRYARRAGPLLVDRIAGRRHRHRAGPGTAQLSTHGLAAVPGASAAPRSTGPGPRLRPAARRLCPLWTMLSRSRSVGRCGPIVHIGGDRVAATVSHRPLRTVGGGWERVRLGAPVRR